MVGFTLELAESPVCLTQTLKESFGIISDKALKKKRQSHMIVQPSLPHLQAQTGHPLKFLSDVSQSNLDGAHLVDSVTSRLVSLEILAGEGNQTKM